MWNKGLIAPLEKLTITNLICWNCRVGELRETVNLVLKVSRVRIPLPAPIYHTGVAKWQSAGFRHQRE